MVFVLSIYDLCRNLIESQRIRMASNYEDLVAVEMKERQRQAAIDMHNNKGHNVNEDHNDTNKDDDSMLVANLPQALPDKNKTRDVMADVSNTSARNYSKGKTIIKVAPQAIQDAWDAGRIATHRAYEPKFLAMCVANKLPTFALKVITLIINSVMARQAQLLA